MLIFLKRLSEKGAFQSSYTSRGRGGSGTPPRADRLAGRVGLCENFSDIFSIRRLFCKKMLYIITALF